MAVVALVFGIRDSGPVPRGEVLTEPPPEVVGTWTTGDARFAGRAFTVSESEVIFGTGGDGPPTRGPITRVSSWAERGTTVVRIEYETPDGEQSVEIFLAGPDRLRLRNPPEVVWTR